MGEESHRDNDRHRAKRNDELDASHVEGLRDQLGYPADDEEEVDFQQQDVYLDPSVTQPQPRGDARKGKGKKRT